MREPENIRLALQTVANRALLSALCEAQGYRCGVCGQRLAALRTASDQSNPRRPTFEHVVPTTLGGHDGKGNIFAAHEKCNHEKGHRYPNDQELETLKRVNRIMGWPDRIQRAA